MVERHSHRNSTASKQAPLPPPPRAPFSSLSLSPGRRATGQSHRLREGTWWLCVTTRIRQVCRQRARDGQTQAALPPSQQRHTGVCVVSGWRRLCRESPSFGGLWASGEDGPLGGEEKEKTSLVKKANVFGFGERGAPFSQEKRGSLPETKNDARVVRFLHKARFFLFFTPQRSVLPRSPESPTRSHTRTAVQPAPAAGGRGGGEGAPCAARRGGRAAALPIGGAPPRRRPALLSRLLPPLPPLAAPPNLRDWDGACVWQDGSRDVGEQGTRAGADRPTRRRLADRPPLRAPPRLLAPHSSPPPTTHTRTHVPRTLI